MAILSKVNTSDEVEKERDSVGFVPWTTDIYPCAIKMAYVSESAKGSMFVHLEVENQSGALMREDIYISRDRENNQVNYYERDGKKRLLMGFSIMDSIARIVADKSITEMDTEPKAVKVYDYDAKKEVAKQMEVIVDFLDAEIYLAVEEQIVDVNKADANGVYKPSGKTRKENHITKAFRAEDMLTALEIEAEAEKPVIFDQWLEKNKGEVIDRSKGTASTGTAGVPGKAANATPTKSLFKKKAG